MKVYITVSEYGGDITGCYERLDLALEFAEEGEHIIEQEVYQEPQKLQQPIIVIQKSWDNQHMFLPGAID